MAWQSMTGMGGVGNGGGGNGSVSDGSQQVAQPQGTEYTLQGTTPHFDKFSWTERLTGMIQVLCDFYKPNGIDMNEIAMVGRLRGRR